MDSEYETKYEINWKDQRRAKKASDVSNASHLEMDWNLVNHFKRNDKKIRETTKSEEV